MKKTLSSIIVCALITAICILPAAALETAVENQPVTIGDIEWRFIPAGDGVYHLQSVATEQFLRVNVDALEMGAEPHGWVYGEHDEASDTTMFSPDHDAPLRYSPNMSRWSARRAFTYIALFEKMTAEGAGGTRYIRANEVTDNAVYIIMGMDSDDGVPKALSNFLETNDGVNMGGVAVDIINGEYITFDPVPETSPDPAPEPEPENTPAVNGDISGEEENGGEAGNNNNNETAPAQNDSSAVNNDSPNIILLIVIGVALLAIIIVIVAASPKKKK